MRVLGIIRWIVTVVLIAAAVAVIISIVWFQPPS